MRSSKLLCLGIVFVLATGAAYAANLNVSAPQQVTTNEYYERGQSITYDGADYWMFYGRSASETGSYATGNPDINDYVLHYQKAASIADLAEAPAVAVDPGGTPVGDSYLGETGAAVLDSKVWTFATIDDGVSHADLYGYYTADGGATWTTVGPIVEDMSAGQGHHDEIVFDGELWIVEGSGNFTTMHSATPENPASFSAPLTVGTMTGGLCHFFAEDDDLYLALGSAGTYYIYIYDDADTEWDLVDEKAISGYYDPTLFKVGTEYAFYCAPYTGGRQWIVGWTAGALDGSFFDGTERAVVDGRYGSNVWVDMWPIGYTDAGGTTYLFYSSERNPADPGSEIDGNIWYVEVDWPLDEDHYTYIQEAVDAAAAGDEILLADGLYLESNTEVNKSLTLRGESRSGVVIAPVAEDVGLGTSSFDGQYQHGVMVTADDVTIQDLTIDGAANNLAAGGTLPDHNNFRIGILNYADGNDGYSGLTVANVNVEHIRRRGISIWPASTGNHVIQGCSIIDVDYQQGISCAGAPFTITGNTVAEAGMGIGLFPELPPDSGVQMTVTDNILYDIAGAYSEYYGHSWPSVGIYFRNPNYDQTLICAGNDLAIGDGEEATGLPGVTGMYLYNCDENSLIQSNTIDATGGVANWGIYLGGCAGTTVENNTFTLNERDAGIYLGRGNPTDPIPNQIIGNLFTSANSASESLPEGCALVQGNHGDLFWMVEDPQNTDNVISQNIIEGFVTGLLFHSDGVSTHTVQATLSGNSITGCSSLAVDASTLTAPQDEPIVASGNYWGTADPAGVANVVSNVDYTPWLASGTDTSSDPGFQGDFSVLWVDDDSPQTESVGRIQEAVDCVSGSTVHIAPGMYAESVDIDVAVRLIGAGSGESPAENTIITNNANVITVSASGASSGDPVLFQDLRVEPDGVYGFNLGNVEYVKLERVVVDGNDPIDDSESNVGMKVSSAASVHHLEIVDCAFDHLVHGWYFAKDYGSGPGSSNVTDVTVTGTSFSHNKHKGIYVEKLAHAVFTDCVVHNNGSDPGFWNWTWNGGLDINLKGELAYENYSFINCTVTNNGLYAQEGVGLTVKGRGTGDDSGYAADPAYVDNVLIQGGLYTGNERGIRFGEPGKNNTTPTNVRIVGAVIQDNVGLYAGGDGSADGGLVNATTALVDARGNWWGDPSGPSGIGSGTGDEIAEAFAGTVLYDPWLGGNVVCVPDPQTISLADAGAADEVAVRYLGGASGPVYGYSIDVEWDGAVITASTGSFQRPATGPFAGAALFQVVEQAGNHVTIDAALGGAHEGTYGPDDLFVATFTAAAGVTDYATSPVTVTVSEMRDGLNVDLTGVYDDDGLVIVDLQGPAIADVAIENTTLAHTNDYIKNGDQAQVTATVSDGDPQDLTTADIEADLTGLGGAAAVHPDTYDAVTGLATWTIGAPGVTTTPADGTVTVTVSATDGSGNTTGGDDTIIADNTKPAPLTGLVAMPGHEKVELSWDDASAGDTHYDGVLLRYSRWNDYPQYDDSEPVYPDTPAAGVGTAYEGGGTNALHEFDPADRDIYYYAGFVYDIARNYSDAPGAGENQDRSTNYWLGDISGDGEVWTADISSLGATYYLTEGQSGFEPACDVGPTDDGTRLGIPLPDDVVDFDDLMVFAMNFGVVTGDMMPGEAGGEIVALGEYGSSGPAGSIADVSLSLEMPDQVAVGEEFTVTVHLTDESAAVQGCRFVVAHDPQAVAFCGASPGALTGQLEASFFKALARESGSEVTGSFGAALTDVSVAAIGGEQTFGGSGCLAVLRFRRIGEGPVALRLAEVQARDTQNQELLPETMDGEFASDGAAAVPTTVYLHGSRPNPVAGQAAISYGLPADGRVRLAIYDATGRVVRILAEGVQAAGEHVVYWNRAAQDGSPVAGGLYFYRLETDDRVLTRKMVVSR